METHYFKNDLGDRGVAFVVWDNKWHELESKKYETIEDLLNDCAGDFIPSAQRDYRKEVKYMLAAYIREIYKESRLIHEASQGDGRKHLRAYYINEGRLFAIRDIVRALGMNDAEDIGSYAFHYYDNPRTSGINEYFTEDVRELEWRKDKFGEDFYKYGFNEEEK